MQAYQTGIQLDFDLHSENNLYSNSRPYTKANLIDLSDLVIKKQVPIFNNNLHIALQN